MAAEVLHEGVELLEEVGSNLVWAFVFGIVVEEGGLNMMGFTE